MKEPDPEGVTLIGKRKDTTITIRISPTVLKVLNDIYKKFKEDHLKYGLNNEHAATKKVFLSFMVYNFRDHMH